MILTRRGILGVLAGLITSPMIIRTPGLLMPVKPPPMDVPQLQASLIGVGEVPPPAVVGDIWFDTKDNGLWMYDGTKWFKPTLDEWCDAKPEQRFVEQGDNVGSGRAIPCPSPRIGR